MKLPPSEHDAIIAAYRSGMSAVDIGKWFGVCAMTVFSVLKLHGEPTRAHYVDWRDDEIAAIRQAWDAGETVAAIARRLARPKDAVSGKVFRLKLAKRPSPIKLRTNCAPNVGPVGAR